MFKVKFIGGPLGGTVEDRGYVPRTFMFKSPRGNGTYVRTELDVDIKRAVMKWEEVNCNRFQKGSSTFELIVAVFLVGLIAIAVVAIATAETDRSETKCVGGFVHSNDRQSNAHQIVDHNGNGIPCQKP